MQEDFLNEFVLIALRMLSIMARVGNEKEALRKS
jgi:hypothetical protein